MHQQLAHHAAHFAIDQHAFVAGIEIPNVLGDLLVIPSQLAGIGIERDDAVGVQIVARAIARVEIRRGVADAPINQD